MTAKVVSCIGPLAATFRAHFNGLGGFSPTLRQFPAEQGTNGNQALA